MYKMTPRNINSSNKTDFICHHSPANRRLKLKTGFISNRSPKYMRIKKPEEQHKAETRKNKKKSVTLCPVGFKPNTPRSFFSNSQINNHEIAICTIIPIIDFL